jgi:hypothetical protein
MTNEFSQGTKSSVSITDDVIEDAKAAGFYVDGRNIYESESDFLCGVKISKKINRLVELQRQRERQAVAVPVAEMFIATEKVSQAKHINVYGLEGYRQGEEANGLPDGTYNIVDAAPPANTVKQEAVIPEGRKLVPIEPTSEMLKAAYVDYESDKYTGPSSMYKAMLSAAPDCPHPIVEELTKE